MSTDKNKALYQSGNTWVGRSLENYKSMHAKLAEEKGLGAEFKAAKTLTEARKILFGSKKGQRR